MAKTKELKQAKIPVEIGGKMVRKSIYYHTVDEYAEKKKKVLEDAARQNMLTFKTVAERWQTEHDETVEAYTVSCYKRPVQDLIESFGGFLLTDITSPMVQQYLNDLFCKKYAKQTISLRKIAMKQIFDYALYHGYVDHNPVIVCKIPKNAQRSERELPSEKEIEKIKNDTDSYYGLFLNLLLYTGLRKEEALALTYEDVDFKNNEIAVNKAIIFQNNRGVVRNGTKSKAGMRRVPLLDPLKKLLDKNGTGPIFYSESVPMTKSRFDKGLRRYLDSMEINCTCHQLRHYFCTFCFEADLDEKDLQGIMGHSKVSTSKDIYTHIRADRKKSSAEKLNAFFKKESA